MAVVSCIFFDRFQRLKYYYLLFCIDENVFVRFRNNESFLTGFGCNPTSVRLQNMDCNVDNRKWLLRVLNLHAKKTMP